MPHMPRSLLLLPVCLALLVALAACGEKAAEPQGARAGEGPVPVTTQQVRLQEFGDTLVALGTVHAREAVTVTAKVSETVQQVHFDSGDVVPRGAPLVTLSGQQQQASLVEAQATANEAERLYRRQAELAGQQLIARASLDTQRATRDAANARVAQIRAQLGDRTIRAPFAGVLGIRQVSPGALVTPGTAIATLDDIAQVAAGQRVSGTSASWPQREFDGTVATVDARLDAGSRAVNVRADFPNTDRALRPGMLVEVTVHRSPRQAILLPEIAVVQVGQKTFVWRVGADGKVAQAEVKVGVRRAGQAEVTEGLAVGDRIVVEGTGKLRPGAVVQDAATPKSAAKTAG